MKENWSCFPDDAEEGLETINIAEVSPAVRTDASDFLIASWKDLRTLWRRHIEGGLWSTRGIENARVSWLLQSLVVMIWISSLSCVQDTCTEATSAVLLQDTVHALTGKEEVRKLRDWPLSNKAPDYEGAFDWQLWRMAHVTRVSVLLRFAVLNQLSGSPHSQQRAAFMALCCQAHRRCCIHCLGISAGKCLKYSEMCFLWFFLLLLLVSRVTSRPHAARRPLLRTWLLLRQCQHISI